ncbi:MAG: hypothetical protein KBE77_03775 [Aliarcobacter sp.]|nr:hypothetical protein [Aliarcobacter sp.]
MKIEKLFSNLSRHKELIFYLFEHRDKIVFKSECEKFTSFEALDILDNFEIIEINGEKVFLDSRVINFLENYLELDENIEISKVNEIINSLKHNIEIGFEFRDKQKTLIPKIRRELKKCDFTMLQNLLKLRIHIDRVYKSIDNFALKIKELEYYKTKLKEFSLTIQSFEKFLFLYEAKLSDFYNSDLNEILKDVKTNFQNLNASLIPLTFDVIEYINKAQKQNIFIEKIAKLKELKDSLQIKEQTNIVKLSNSFDLIDSMNIIKTRLDSEILNSEDFKNLVEKISVNSKLKSKKADVIEFDMNSLEYDFIDIYSLHLQFKSSRIDLINFLLQNSKTKDKTLDEISEIYCRMILLYEDIYNITEDANIYQNTTFRKIYYE